MTQEKKPRPLSAFGKWLKKRRITNAEAAKKLGITGAYVSMLRARDRSFNVSVDLAGRIAKWTRKEGEEVPIEAWL